MYLHNTKNIIFAYIDKIKLQYELIIRSFGIYT